MAERNRKDIKTNPALFTRVVWRWEKGRDGKWIASKRSSRMLSWKRRYDP